MARISLITPGHLSTNPRIIKEADTLAEAGHRVQVIACDFATWPRETDGEFVTRPWRIQERIVFGPHAPLHQRTTQYIRQRLARFLFWLGVRTVKVECAACHPIAPDLVKAAARERADLYVAHYIAAFPAAALAAAKYGALYAFDAEDFHLGDLPDTAQYAFDKRLIHAIEGRYLKGCAYVTAASPGIAASYAREYDVKPPSVVLNVFPRSQGVEAPSARGAAWPGPSIYWFSQTIGPNRGLECAVQAIGRAKSKPHLYLRGNVTKQFRDVLNTVAKDVDAPDRVHLLRPAAPKEMARLAACYDLGLVAETGETLNRRIALTNKQFTYLLAGLPVLMSDVPAHREFAANLDDVIRLYAAGNADDLAAAIDAWLLEADVLAAARERAWTLGQSRLNWELEKKVFLKTLNKALVNQSQRGQG